MLALPPVDLLVGSGRVGGVPPGQPAQLGDVGHVIGPPPLGRPQDARDLVQRLVVAASVGGQVDRLGQAPVELVRRTVVADQLEDGGERGRLELDAAIWVSAVQVPVPMSAAPISTEWRPSGPTRIVAADPGSRYIG